MRFELQTMQNAAEQLKRKARQPLEVRHAATIRAARVRLLPACGDFSHLWQPLQGLLRLEAWAMHPQNLWSAPLPVGARLKMRAAGGQRSRSQWSRS